MAEIYERENQVIPCKKPAGQKLVASPYHRLEMYLASGQSTCQTEYPSLQDDLNAVHCDPPTPVMLK